MSVRAQTMDVSKTVKILKDHIHVAAERGMSWVKTVKPAPYHVEEFSQKPVVGLSALLNGLSDIPLRTSAVSG